MPIGENLFRFREKTDLKYIVWDVESESLSPFLSRPWEISWIVVENGQITERHQKFPFIHDLKVSDGAAKVTRFNYKDYKAKSEPAIDVYNLFAKYLYNPEYYAVGQNVLNFDTYQWATFCRYVGKPVDYSFVPRIYDTRSLGFAFNTQNTFPHAKGDITPWMYRMCSIKQKGIKASNKSMAAQFDIPYSEFDAHIGLKDCEISDGIFRALYRKMDIH